MRDKITVATVHSEALLGAAKPRSCQLLVVDGPDAGRAVSLGAGSSDGASGGDREMRIGSGEDCDLVLSDDRVSRHHLGVRESAGRFLVRDLGSKNGTLYEGSLVTEVRVGPGATFKVGRSFLRIQPRPQPLEVTPSQARRFGDLVAESLAMREIFAVLELAAGSDVTVLDDRAVVVDGVRFLGSTLWSDFLLDGAGARPAAMEASQRFARDFSVIRSDDGRPFTPEASAACFARHAAWLALRLDEPHDGPTVVVTHHAPSRGSVHPRFAGSPVNPCFVSDLEHLMGGDRVALWIHGHTHDSFDYEVAGTRVVSNPRGYAKDGRNENPAFDPALVVEVR